MQRDMRRSHVVESTSPKATEQPQEQVETLKPVTSTTPSSRSNDISIFHYQYLPKDLIKTASLTGAIILAELLLFFLAKR